MAWRDMAKVPMGHIIVVCCLRVGGEKEEKKRRKKKRGDPSPTSGQAVRAAGSTGYVIVLVGVNCHGCPARTGVWTDMDVPLTNCPLA